MSDRYLWDKSGEPDPEIQRLEAALGQLGYRPKPFAQPKPRLRYMAIAAAVVVAVGAGTFMLLRPHRSWNVAALAGAPAVGGSPESAKGMVQPNGRLRQGDWLVTDAASRARVEVGEIGTVRVDPNSRVRLVNADPSEHRLALDSGRIEAAIWAPPRLFFVNTPSGVVVDLGCAYTLEVAGDGSAVVRVRGGWVSFESNGRSAYIPAGAVCRVRGAKTPGTPHYDDVSDALRNALERFDATGDVSALAIVLAEARPRDAMTLWHLLERTSDETRASVYDRLSALAKPPEGVSREGVLKGDSAMRERWWNSFGLGELEWWKSVNR